MTAVFQREIRAYFVSPLGYVLIGAMYFFTGYFFYGYNLIGNTTDMSGLYADLFTVTLFLVPVLTMRLMSEDKRAKTDQLLLTSPIGRSGIVFGKYLAAILVYLLMISCTVLCAALTAVYSSPDWPVVVGNFLGLLLLGCTQIAVCMFLSSLTESQVIAAVSGFGVSLFLMLCDSLAATVGSRLLQGFLRGLSFNERYRPFTLGILETANLVFFLSVAALFLAFSVLVLEKRRYN